MKKFLTFAALATSAFVVGCAQDAQVVSHNISRAADNFEINRRIVFYNGITGDYILTIEGLCSQEDTGNKLAVTCKVSPGVFKKHFLKISDNVTYFSEQMDPASASTQHYRVTFKPSVILPSIDVR